VPIVGDLGIYILRLTAGGLDGMEVAVSVSHILHGLHRNLQNPTFRHCRRIYVPDKWYQSDTVLMMELSWTVQRVFQNALMPVNSAIVLDLTTGGIGKPG
jgi:hypothetical protein